MKKIILSLFTFVTFFCLHNVNAIEAWTGMQDFINSEPIELFQENDYLKEIEDSSEVLLKNKKWELYLKILEKIRNKFDIEKKIEVIWKIDKILDGMYLVKSPNREIMDNLMVNLRWQIALELLENEQVKKNVVSKFYYFRTYNNFKILDKVGDFKVESVEKEEYLNFYIYIVKYKNSKWKEINISFHSRLSNTLHNSFGAIEIEKIENRERIIEEITRDEKIINNEYVYQENGGYNDKKFYIQIEKIMITLKKAMII